eukprot:GEMP01075546.1.p1 GENE.GEMP01075546.1~~GEMP01075546.1.p1  ORF type:complete len:291 (+),score=63.22 GEMP01075546.1:25-873(+)
MAVRPAQVNKVICVMQEIAPTHLAESWDNVGMLMDTLRKNFPTPFKVFLTNDLTEKVAKEAVSKEAHMIVTYHPTPFGKTNKLLVGDHISRIVLLLAGHQIAVYSPHTALDCVDPGINDWLISAFACTDKTACQPIKDGPVNRGAGRVGSVAPMSLTDAVEAVKKHLDLPFVRVAARHSDGLVRTKDDALQSGGEIRRVAVCAGSGASVFRGVKDVDLLVSGEMSHHEVLAATQNGQNVILTEHTNTERGYLKVLQKRLDEGLGSEFEIMVTEVDADPLIVA